ncbi:MAG: winged helix-turn-helix domain-containing protein [Gammaproteobacteria bacterium]
MSQPVPDSLAFDDVVIDFAGRRLLRGGDEQALEPKAFAVLALLVASPGRVFTRDEILDAVWGHRHVTQSVLNRIMSLLRQALGEDAQHPRRLHTVHGIGYRFDRPAPAPKSDSAATAAAATAAAAAAAATAAAADAPTPTSSNPRSTTFVVAAPEPVRNRWPWLAIAAAVALLAFAGIAWLHKEKGAATPAASAWPDTSAPPTRPSLAVLPFTDLSQSHDQEYLADGLAEEILNQLAQVPALRLVGRSSSFSFKGKDADLRTIGQKLGVAHLLEGSVRKAGDQLRITAQLIRADDGTHLWSKTYARELRDVFALQDEISRDVAHALSVKLDVLTFNREQGGTINVDAYERFLRWRSIGMQELFDFEHDRERLQLAREMVALDPQCVLCRDALASSLNSVAQEVGGVQAEQLRAEGAEVRELIARIAPDSWVAKRDRSNALWREGKRAEAIALAKEIADSGPPTKERAWDYAYMIYAMGHLNETIALVEQVRAVEPLALFLSRDLQFDYTAARRYQDAEAEYQRGLKMEGSQTEPNFVAFFRQLAGKRPGGLAELRGLHRQLLQQSKDLDSPFFRDLGNVLNDRAAMLALVRKALAYEAYRGNIDSEYVTDVADALGDADLAVAAMRKDLEGAPGFKERAMTQFPYVVFWNTPYSHARAHPDYKKLLIEAGVADYWRQTGKWGDGCRPVGTDDFQCQ